MDQRLATPGTRFEIVDGRSVYVAPADEPRGERIAGVGCLLGAHRAAGYSAAIRMLTRTSQIDDLAPDVSVYPTARDPRTGGRQLEELAFLVASTELLAYAGTKAGKLVACGVRRVFALHLERAHVLEWSQEQGQWSPLERGSSIIDPALAVPLPVEALLEPALTDDAIVRAFRLQRHPEFLAERAEGEAAGEAEARAEREAKERAEGEAQGRAKGLLIALARQGFHPTDDAIVRAYRLKRHPEFLAERAEGEAAGKAKARAEREAKGRAERKAKDFAESLLIALAGRGLDLTEGERQLILAERDLVRLERWLAAAGTCANLAELLALP